MENLNDDKTNYTLCETFVKDAIFYLLTTPEVWRYERGEWSIGEAKNLDEYIQANSKYLYNEILNEKNAEFFNIKQPDDEDEDAEDEYYEAECEIFSIIRNMFPIVDVLHGDDQDAFKDKFLPDMYKFYNLFHNDNKKID